MTKDQVIRRGQAAERILKDEIALRAFEAVIADMQEEWLRSRPDDVAAREGCFRMVNAVQRVVAKLQSWQANGAMEAENAEQRQREAQGQAAFH